MNKDILRKAKRNFIEILYAGSVAAFLADDELYQKIVLQLAGDLCNLDVKTIGNLSERETWVLRKRIGLLDNGKMQSFSEIGKIMSVTASRVQQILPTFSKKLRLYITSDKHNLLKEDISKNDISVMMDMEIRYMGLGKRETNCLIRAGINTLRHLTMTTSEELFKIGNFGKVSYDKINQLLNEYNLSLADDIVVGKEKINKYDVIKALIYRFEVDEKDYKFVQQMVDELYDLRDNKVLSLNSRETFIIRKLCGILDNGVKQSIKEICSYLRCPIKDGNENIESAFDTLRKYFKTYVYNETIKLNKSDLLKSNLKYLNLDDYTYISLREKGIYTLENLIEYFNKGFSNRYNYITPSDMDKIPFLINLVEEKGLTKEQLEEKKRKEREEQAKQEQERLEKNALIEKRKNELLKARDVLIEQREKAVIELRRKEELLKNYYDNQLDSVEVKIKKLDNE